MIVVELLTLYLSSYHTPETLQSSSYHLLQSLHTQLTTPTIKTATQPPPPLLILPTLPLPTLRALSAACAWCVAEVRCHMEDESDVRLTAALERIGEWSSLKAAVDERIIAVQAMETEKRTSRL